MRIFERASQRILQRIIGGFRMIIPVEQERRPLGMLRVRADPGVFVCEAPGLEGSASWMRETRESDLAIDIGLQLQIRGKSIAVRIDGERDIHFGDVHLQAESSEALYVGRNGGDIGVEIRNVHLKSNAVDGNSMLPEIPNHGIDRVRLWIDSLRLRIVVKQQCLRVGLVGPAETAFNIKVGLLRAASCVLRASAVGGGLWRVACSY